MSSTLHGKVIAVIPNPVAPARGKRTQTLSRTAVRDLLLVILPQRRADICAGSACTLVELDADAGVLSGSTRLNFTLHFPDATKVCSIDGRNRAVRAFAERILTERMNVCRHFLPRQPATTVRTVHWFTVLVRILAL